jgi:hypothetical protein
MKPLQPLSIADVGLASGHVLGVARIDQNYLKATGVEQLEDRDPVDAGRLHNDRLDAAFRKPVHQPMQIGRKGTKGAYRIGRAICAHRCHMHRRSNVDRGRIRVDDCHRSADRAFRFFSDPSPNLLFGAEGLGCANNQLPKRDRSTASPLSSAQQPMDHVF